MKTRKRDCYGARPMKTRYIDNFFKLRGAEKYALFMSDWNTYKRDKLVDVKFDNDNYFSPKDTSKCTRSVRDCVRRLEKDPYWIRSKYEEFYEKYYNINDGGEIVSPCFYYYMLRVEEIFALKVLCIEASVGNDRDLIYFLRTMDQFTDTVSIFNIFRITEMFFNVLINDLRKWVLPHLNNGDASYVRLTTPTRLTDGGLFESYKKAQTLAKDKAQLLSDEIKKTTALELELIDAKGRIVSLESKEPSLAEAHGMVRVLKDVLSEEILKNGALKRELSELKAAKKEPKIEEGEHTYEKTGHKFF